MGEIITIGIGIFLILIVFSIILIKNNNKLKKVIKQSNDINSYLQPYIRQDRLIESLDIEEPLRVDEYIKLMLNELSEEGIYSVKLTVSGLKTMKASERELLDKKIRSGYMSMSSYLSYKKNLENKIETRVYFSYDDPFEIHEQLIGNEDAFIENNFFIEYDEIEKSFLRFINDNSHKLMMIHKDGYKMFIKKSLGETLAEKMTGEKFNHWG